MSTLGESSPPAREPGFPAATLFLALLALAALVLIGYLAFAPRPQDEPANSAITIEEPARAPR